MKEIPQDLPGLLNHLEANNWGYKLVRKDFSEDHEYVSTVWMSDELGGSRKQRASTAVEALTLALLDALKCRQNRMKNRLKREREALLREKVA